MQLSQKKKVLLDFFLHFGDLGSILNIFIKNMTLILGVFLKLWTRKNVVI